MASSSLLFDLSGPSPKLELELELEENVILSVRRDQGNDAIERDMLGPRN